MVQCYRHEWLVVLQKLEFLSVFRHFIHDLNRVLNAAVNTIAATGKETWSPIGFTLKQWKIRPYTFETKVDVPFTNSRRSIRYMGALYWCCRSRGKDCTTLSYPLGQGVGNGTTTMIWREQLLLSIQVDSCKHSNDVTTLCCCSSVQTFFSVTNSNIDYRYILQIMRLHPLECT